MEGTGTIFTFALPMAFGAQKPTGGIMELMVHKPEFTTLTPKGPAPLAGLILAVLIPLDKFITKLPGNIPEEFITKGTDAGLQKSPPPLSVSNSQEGMLKLAVAMTSFTRQGATGSGL